MKYDYDIGYLQHGAGQGPFLTESVKVRHHCPSIWEAYYMHQWRKVYIQMKRTYIVFRGNKVTIQIDNV